VAKPRGRIVDHHGQSSKDAADQELPGKRGEGAAG
jgi:hypothetical protein